MKSPRGLSLANSKSSLHHPSNLGTVGASHRGSSPRHQVIHHEITELDAFARRDANMFSKRMAFIKRQLDGEIDAARQVSRDRTRTNRNGVVLEQLDPTGRTMAGGLGVDPDEFLPPTSSNPFKRDRRSVDMPQ